MSKVIYTVGFPGSGKTTLAEAMVKEYTAAGKTLVNINRDDIRQEVGIDTMVTGVGTPEQEGEVTVIAAKRLDAALTLGFDAIVSDTNMRMRFLRESVKKVLDAGADFDIFPVEVPLDELLRRDAARIADGRRGVGEEVIRNFWMKFPRKNWPTKDRVLAAIALDAQKAAEEQKQVIEYKQSPLLPKVLLVDIDGTLAHHGDRRDIFDLSKVHLDELDVAVAHAIAAYHAAGYKIIIMSGREGTKEARELTLYWLTMHKIPFLELFMRAEGDMRPDWIVKDELLRTHIQDHYYIEAALDDRNCVVDHYRAIGLKVFQVQPGDF